MWHLQLHITQLAELRGRLAAQQSGSLLSGSCVWLENGTACMRWCMHNGTARVRWCMHACMRAVRHACMCARAEGERAFPQSDPEVLRLRGLRDAAREDFSTRQGMPLPPHISVEDFFDVRAAGAGLCRWGCCCCNRTLPLCRWLPSACHAPLCCPCKCQVVGAAEGADPTGLLRRCCVRGVC